MPDLRLTGAGDQVIMFSQDGARLDASIVTISFCTVDYLQTTGTHTCRGRKFLHADGTQAYVNAADSRSWIAPLDSRSLAKLLEIRFANRDAHRRVFSELVPMLGLVRQQ